MKLFGSYFFVFISTILLFFLFAFGVNAQQAISCSNAAIGEPYNNMTVPSTQGIGNPLRLQFELTASEGFNATNIFDQYELKIGFANLAFNRNAKYSICTNTAAGCDPDSRLYINTQLIDIDSNVYLVTIDLSSNFFSTDDKGNLKAFLTDVNNNNRVVQKTGSTSPCSANFTLVSENVNNTIESGRCSEVGKTDGSNSFTCRYDTSVLASSCEIDSNRCFEATLFQTTKEIIPFEVGENYCDPGFVPDISCEGGTLGLPIFQDSCLPCIPEQEANLRNRGRFADCSLENDLCDSSQSLKCTEIEGSTPMCLFSKMIDPNPRLNPVCIVGYESCLKRDRFAMGVEYQCVNGTGLNSIDYTRGEEGTCQEVTNGIQCQNTTNCESIANDLGYAGAACVGGFCSFYNDLNINSNKDTAGNQQDAAQAATQLNLNEIEELQNNLNVDRCNGSDQCTQCMYRTRTGGILTFDQAIVSARRLASVKDRLLSGDITNEEANAQIQDIDIIPTNYIYTAIGCIEPSVQGVTVRLMQIGIGVSGILLLFRLGQAVFMFQKGDPESFKEGSSIALSALFALIMLILAASGLVFLGVDVFRFFSPGTLELQ